MMKKNVVSRLLCAGLSASMMSVSYTHLEAETEDL